MWAFWGGAAVVGVLAWDVQRGEVMSLGKQFEFVRVRSTNECTTCDLCGRMELKATVELIATDRETGDREEVYYGSGCAKKALGWGPGMTVPRFEKAMAAKREAIALAAEQAAGEAAHNAAVDDFRKSWPLGPGGMDNAKLMAMKKEERYAIVNAYFAAKDAAVAIAKKLARAEAMRAPVAI